MMITHRCKKCSHVDFRRKTRDGADGTWAGNCECGCKCRPGPSEVIPTFDQAGRKVERIAIPGRWIGEDLGRDDQKGQVQACGCEKCRALHKSLTTV